MISREYNYFIEIAKQQSILNASDILYVSPSALSKYIQRLEKEVGAKLFERIGKRFVLTYAGERYLAWCEKLQEMEDQCHQEMAEIARTGRKHMKVGIAAVRTRHFIRTIIPDFCERYPNVELTLFERNTDALWPLLCRSELDIIFIYKKNVPPSIQRVAVSGEEMVLCVSKSHPLAQEGENKIGFSYPWIDLRRFTEDGLIVLNSTKQDVVGLGETIFREHVANPRIVMRTMMIESAVNMSAQGMGVSIMPDLAVKLMSVADRIQLFSFGDQTIPCEFAAFFREDLSLRVEMCQLIEIAKRHSKS